MRSLRNMISLVKEAVVEFFREDPFTQAGALSYYTMLSLAPFLLVVVAIVGLVYGDEAARGEVMERMARLAGDDAAAVARQLLDRAYAGGSGRLSAIVGVTGVLVGATTVVARLRAALDRIWDVQPKASSWRALICGRLLSLVFILVLGVAVVALLVVGSVVSALAALPGATGLGWAWRVVDIVGSLAVMTVMFALLFKLLPSARFAWREVFVGAAATSLLFTLGRGVIALYIGRVGVGSAYGAAGSVIVLMAWIYYSALIVLFGAEITEVYARRAGAAGAGAPPHRFAAAP
jgi:membrane protein